MAVNVRIAADVIDIRYDEPKPQDRLLVDAMVWYWLTDTSTIQLLDKSRPYQVADYPQYISLCRKKKATLLWCGLNLTELMHRIEREEYLTFCALTARQMNDKEYRHNEANERERVVAKINESCSQIMSMASSMDTLVDASVTATVLTRMHTQRLDGYDLLVCEAMTRSGVTAIITDDADFATVPDITVFTANRNLLNAAKAQRRLR